MDTKFVMFICGPNGAGKSTFSRGLKIIKNIPLIDPDEYSSQDVSQIDTGRIVHWLLNDYLQNGISFARESTLSSNHDLKMMKKANELGYMTILIYLHLPDEDTACQRVVLRTLKGGHAVPENVIRRRYSRSLKKLEEAKKIVTHCFELTNSLRDMEIWEKENLCPLFCYSR